MFVCNYLYCLFGMCITNTCALYASGRASIVGRHVESRGRFGVQLLSRCQCRKFEDWAEHLPRCERGSVLGERQYGEEHKGEVGWRRRDVDGFSPALRFRSHVPLQAPPFAACSE